MSVSARQREWALKVALVELGLWIARADGSVSRQEAGCVLRLLRDWGATATELEQLKRLGARRVADPEPPRDLLHVLGRLLTAEQRPVFLEVLAEAAFADQPRCSAKVGRLLDVCRALGLEQLRGLQLVNEVAARVGLRPGQPRLDEPTLILPLEATLRRSLHALGIDRPDPVAARRAYRRLTLLYHPDRNPSADERGRDRLLRRLLDIRQAYQHVLASNGLPCNLS